MPEQTDLASQLQITIDGQEVQRDVMSQLVSVVVDQHSNLPDMFTITLFDSDMALLDDGPFNLTKTVVITAESTDGEDIQLIEGEITALAPQFGEGMIAQLVVEGYDKSHRLFRETKTSAFLNKKDSDLAQEIARNANLQTEIETTSTVYDHIFQHNQTDLDFLKERAWRIGYECFVKDNKLYFREPPTNTDTVTLNWGDELKSFLPRMTLAEQVDEVIVRGWDVQRKESIVGRANSGSLYPDIEERQNGAQWAGSFGTGKKVVVDQPVVSQAEADKIAYARLNEISGTFIEADGTAFRSPGISAGKYVDLQGIGSRLSGKYLVTNATHAYTPEGLNTSFSVRGSRAGTISEHMGADETPERYPGVVSAVVTNTDDPNNWGRVKVKFPWMSDDAESDWARLSGPGSGPDAGLICIPEVGDEVLVAFAHGDFSQPIIIGGLWNGQADTPSETNSATSGERPLIRTWKSRTGHFIVMHDDSTNMISIETAGGHKVNLDDANSKISITSAGGLEITLDDNASKISIGSGGEVELTSTSNMKIEAGGNLDLTASGQVNVTGAMINLN